MGGKTDSQV